MPSPNPNSIIIITPPPHPNIVISYPETFSFDDAVKLIQEAFPVAETSVVS